MEYQIESIKRAITSTNKRMVELKEGYDLNMSNRNFTEANLIKQQISGLDSFKSGLEYAYGMITEEI